jgi:hypothetical protein
MTTYRFDLLLYTVFAGGAFLSSAKSRSVLYQNVGERPAAT